MAWFAKLTLSNFYLESWPKHWKLFQFLAQLALTKSEIKLDFYKQKQCVRGTLRVPVQMRT